MYLFNENAVTVTKRIGDAYIIWFKPSRVFVLFEEPAYHIFCMYSSNLPISEISKKCQLLYHLSHRESRAYTFSIIEKIRSFCKDLPVPDTSALTKSAYQHAHFHLYALRKYLIGTQTFTFCYGNSELECCFDPLLKHLAAIESNQSHHLFELFEMNDQLIFRCDDRLLKSFARLDYSQLTRAVFQQIFSLVYDIIDQDWMMNLHASGITDGKSAILFPAGADNGKTTLAALFHAKGYWVIADDFMAVDKHRSHAFRFPAALSIKEGSLKSLSNDYPYLHKVPVDESRLNKQRIRYLALNNNDHELPDSFPVKAVVFIQFAPDREMTFEKIGQKAALRNLLNEAWINPTTDNVNHFFSWLDTVNFYKLTYSNVHHAVDQVAPLFLS